MQIELRNVKYAAFASQETSCFQATVYIDGKRAGEVSNEGHGGPDSISPRELQTRLDEYGASLPKEACDWTDRDTGKAAEISQTAETLIGNALDAWLLQRELKRICKKAAYAVNGKIYTLKVPYDERVREHLAKKYPDAKILNTMPQAEAVALLREYAA